MERKALFESVKECVVATVGTVQEPVRPDSSIIDDIGLDSLDLLDLVFRLERRFGIRIKRGDIEMRAREAMPEEDFETDGILTDQALSQLRKVLPEVPEERFRGPLRKSEIPRLFTVETFMRLVEGLLDRKGDAGEEGGAEVGGASGAPRAEPAPARNAADSSRGKEVSHS